MSVSQFSDEHKTQFRELLAMGIDLYALNRHPEQLSSGPWTICCEQGDSDTKVRLKARFRAAVRKAAVAAGAAARAHLLDWWISKLARGQRRAFLQGLIQKTIEYCEELESNAKELRPLVQEENAAPGLNRDRYPCDSHVPYWLYDEPHRPLPDAEAEFAYWDRHIREGFDSRVAEIASAPRKKRRWVDDDGIAHCGPQEEVRQRIKNRLETRSAELDAWILGLSYDLAVLQANHVIDRGLGAEATVREFEEASAGLVEKVRRSWRVSSIRWGLSWRKQENRGVDLARPFREVSADLRHLFFKIQRSDTHNVAEITTRSREGKNPVPRGPAALEAHQLRGDFHPEAIPAMAERAARRQAVVLPMLKNKRWKRGRLATEAGVGKNSVYRYLDGTRSKISEENRQAIAQALDIRPEELPE